MRNINFKSISVIFGAIGFITIVIALHIVQSDYDSIHQLMSELALGKHGSFMLIAFLSFSISVFFAQSILVTYKNNLLARVLLIVASFSLAGAGLFKLGSHTELHISLVALAFVLIVLSMYLIPRLILEFRNLVPIITCWGFGLGSSISVFLGQGFIPMGIAQRLAVSFILIWLLWLAIFHQKQTWRQNV